MAELAELRTIANTNGGAAMMSSSPERSDFPRDVFVLNCDVLSRNNSRPATSAAGISDILASEHQTNSVRAPSASQSRAARWTSLDANDRKVFEIWAWRVAAFYSLLIFSLVVTMLLCARMPGGRTFLAASPVVERNSPKTPAPITGNVGQ
jgi:hypothetical protein